MSEYENDTLLSKLASSRDTLRSNRGNLPLLHRKSFSNLTANFGEPMVVAPDEVDRYTGNPAFENYILADDGFSTVLVTAESVDEKTGIHHLMERDGKDTNTAVSGGADGDTVKE